MSSPLSPNNRNSIFGWVKNLKKGNLLSSDSINDISDNDLMSSASKSNDQLDQFHDHNNNNHNNNNNNNNHNQEFLRPLLHHKSVSTNNVNRVRSNSQSGNDNKSIRQHRDSFLVNNPLVDENSKYFGVSLEDATNQACAKISIFTHENSSQVLQYGKIPIVVAKCGVYLKNNGLNVEGIFRVGGSSKRLKELQVVFNSPPDFGKKLNWDGYTVHDAASILRRYLNALPEPLIPLELYETFRGPLKNKPRIINYMQYKASNPKKTAKDSQTPVEVLKSPSSKSETPINTQNPSTPLNNINTHDNDNISPSKLNELGNDEKNSLPSPSVSPLKGNETPESTNKEPTTKSKKSKNYKKLTKDVHDAIDEYKKMVDQLPQLSKQLLFYILDLLAMVQNQSSENLMSSRNLAAIFQPSILSHPDHDLDPTEYALSQLVVEFLIQYAYKLLPNQDNLPPLPKENNPKDSLTVKTHARKHSKSLSSNNHDDDLVGYQNNVNSKSLPIIDTDHDFEITDDDQSEFDNRMRSNSNVNSPNDSYKDVDETNSSSEKKPENKSNGSTNQGRVSIYVSTPSSSSIPKET